MKSTELENAFKIVSKALFTELQASEKLSLCFCGEESQFIRFNGGKTRQSGTVSDSTLGIRLYANGKNHSASLPISGQAELDLARAKDFLALVRKEIQDLKPDPFAVLPENKGTSRNVKEGKPPSFESTCEKILKPVAGLDFVGLYAGGVVTRGMADSEGTHHWFSTENFFVDYSLFHKSGKAIKSNYAGNVWEDASYERSIKLARENLIALDMPLIKIPPGKYRTYFAPSATGSLLGMMSWGAVSESARRQGESALSKLSEGEVLSPKFSLLENFTLGLVPSFNEEGELAPQELSIIQDGKLANMLISARTGQEYKIKHNGASKDEGLRSPEVLPGSLKEEDILKTLGTGLYLSDLHYLNWSDLKGGRVTGMTRYAPLWVEDGKIKGPIFDMRFDESLYHFFGEGLVDLTETRAFLPETMTYEIRHLGGYLVPGILVNDFEFTL